MQSTSCLDSLKSFLEHTFDPLSETIPKLEIFPTKSNQVEPSPTAHLLEEIAECLQSRAVTVGTGLHCRNLDLPNQCREKTRIKAFFKIPFRMFPYTIRTLLLATALFKLPNRNPSCVTMRCQASVPRIETYEA